MDRARFRAPQQLKVWDVTAEELELSKSILLVEDDLMFAEVVKENLETYGYSVTVAGDGVQGLKRVMERDFDIVLCDLMMPNLPGDMFYVAVERVKPQVAKRFIFITGHQNNPKISEFVKKVRALTLFKPFEMHLLLETIQTALKPPKKGA